MKLTIAALILIGICQAVYFSKPKIKQRYVQVYVMAPEGNSVVWEAKKEE